ncbi:MAG TPA: cyclophane-forming radical SAM/SPASM peptide maturase YhhB [Pyrinomonadaceae bacterium]
MVELDTVLLKVASRCNLDCGYCYVYNMGDNGWANMPKRMSQETIKAVAQSLSALSRLQQRPFAVVLHGGEPLLLGRADLTRLLTTLRNTLPSEYPISIQTNGVLITDEILNVCSKYHTSLSVSIDGPQHIHDRNRVGRSGKVTHEQVVAGIEKLRNHPDAAFLFSGVLAVIDPQSDVKEVYDFFRWLGAPSVDFLCQDGNHTRLPHGKLSFYSTEYGQWLSRLVDIYLADPEPIRIRLLDDIIKLILGGSGTKDGIGVTDFGIAIIDTDGSITKNDTLKSSYNRADRFTQGWSVHSHSLSEVLVSSEFAEYHAAQRPSCKTCLTCPDLQVCGGGMTLHRWRDDNGYDNPSIYCEDQRLLIGHIRKHLAATHI